jgi:DNA-binding beta-propeller fold protein YncE
MSIAAAALCAVTLFTPAAGWAQPPPYVLSWGSSGTADGQFCQPRGIAVGPSGHVYVADYTSCSRVQEFSTTGAFVRKWGSFGSGLGKFEGPEDIAIDPPGNVYVVDSGQARIQKFTSDGLFLTSWGSYGSGDGEFIHPLGISVAPGGNVYVLEWDNHRVQVFSPTGAYLFKWGAAGSGPGQFQIPIGIAIDAAGFVYVSDTGASTQRIQKFTSGGALVTSWNVCGPQGVEVDASGRVYVAQEGCVDQVGVYDGNGVHLMDWGSTGSGPGEFKGAISVAVAGDGSIFVSEAQNIRIQKFGALPTPVAQSSWGQVKQHYR